MDKYIDREAFIRDKREWYCADCDRRKGMKNGKLKVCYEIGEAPCRACDINDMLTDLEDYPAADVKPVVRGEWIVKQTAIGKYYTVCSVCNTDFKFKTDKGTLARLDMRGMSYCPNCGAELDMRGKEGE